MKSLTQEHIQLILSDNDRLRRENQQLTQQLRNQKKGSMIPCKGGQSVPASPEYLNVNHTSLLEQLTKAEADREKKEQLMRDNSRLFTLNTSLEQELEATRVQISRLRQENNGLRSQLASISQRTQHMQSHTIGIDAHRHELSRLNQLINNQKTTTQKYATECVRLAGELRTAKQHIETINLNLYQAMNQNAYLKSQIDAIQRTFSETEAFRFRNAPADSQLQARVRLLEAQAKEKQLVLQVLRQKMQKADGGVKQAKRLKAEQLRKQLQTQRTINRQLREDTQKIVESDQERRIRQLGNAKTVFEEGNIQLRKALSQKDLHIKQLQKMLEGLRNSSDLVVYSDNES